jgi:hypothetical protein
MAQRCTKTTKNGTQCRNTAIDGSEFCISHDPTRCNEMARKRSKSWNVHLSPEEVGPPPVTPSELILALGETIQHVRTNRLDPARGKCVAELCRVAYRLMGSEEKEMQATEKEYARMSDEQLIKKIAEMKKELGMSDA